MAAQVNNASKFFFMERKIIQRHRYSDNRTLKARVSHEISFLSNISLSKQKINK